MLAKIGLPPKPSMRGSNWVIDASHCQGCNSQFSFINRKHHCRRCGGLFCSSCTAQRMILRGQGDSPVRICDPCKKTEEDERESKYGHKNRALKGTSKSSSKQEDELLAQILGFPKSNPKMPPNESSSSISNPKNDDKNEKNEENEIIKSLTLSLDSPQNVQNDNLTPEELRNKAIEEKKMHKILKSKGKNKEALLAFKRGREFERQADALETALKKNKRLASKNIDKNEKSTSIKRENSKKKDDLASELRDLGWQDEDIINEKGLNAKNLTLEGELSSIIGEITKTPSKVKRIDNSEVIALKRRALVLKKEGRLNEAKEELKKAKILEKQLEEKLILGDSDESDDELGALMKELNNNNEKNNNNDRDFDNFDLGLNNNAQLGLPIGGFDLEKLLSGDLDHNFEFEVTKDDLNDPNLNSDLKSFGWSEDDEPEQIQIQTQNSNNSNNFNDLNENNLDKVNKLKKEAVMQKRAGNNQEAMSLLKQAKLIERNLQEVSNNNNNDNNSNNNNIINNYINKPVSRNRLAIQRELLAVKKNALVLRREGKINESERELERGKVLERELEQIDNSKSNLNSNLNQDQMIQNPLELLNDKHEEIEVTDNDMWDPDLNSVLKNLGWNEEKDDADVAPVYLPKKPLKKSKIEIQRELLKVKKNALVLRREGKTEESERELERGRVLEREMQEFETPAQIQAQIQIQNLNVEDKLGFENEIIEPEVTDSDLKDPDLNSFLKNLGWEENENADVAPPVEKPKVSFAKKPPKKSKFAIQRELLAIKKTALNLRREGKIEDSERELERGKLLEEQLKEFETADVAPPPADVAPRMTPSSADVAPSSADVAPLNADVAPFEKKTEVENDILSVLKTSVYEKNEGADVARSDLPAMLNVKKKSKAEIQRELLLIKRKALQLRREGKNEEYESEIEKCKDLEAQLNELEASSSVPTGEQNVTVESVFEEPSVVVKDENDILKNEILMHKRKALALKKEGRLSEAKEELKQAKVLERNLEESTNQTTNLNPDININTHINNNNVNNIINEVVSVQEVKPIVTRKPVSGRERFKIQQESLSHKRNALKLRREGKIEESEREFELAKSLEAQLEDDVSADVSNEMSGDVMVEDFLDPALMSALKGIGWGDVESSRNVERESRVREEGSRRGVEERESRVRGEGSRRSAEERESRVRVEERERMEEEIKREKVRAVGLKRAGKMKEAMEALKSAKLMEKKLALIN